MNVETIEFYKERITIERIASYENALKAHQKAKRGKRQYYEIVEFEKDLENNLKQLCEEFKNGTYRTGGYITKTIIDGKHKKERVIAKVSYKDRVAQWMIALKYEPLYLEMLNDHTHASIPKRGIHTALKESEKYIRDDGYEFCLKIDIHHYFDNVHRCVLMEQLSNDFYDERVYKIMCDIVKDAPRTGIPIGNYLSQFFANRYLTSFDYWLEERCAFVRYMDDICVFSHSKDDLKKLFREIEWKLKRDFYLDVKPNWQIFRIEDRGLDFVGYRMWKNRTILRKTSLRDTRRMYFEIEKRIKHNIPLTERDRCKIMSRHGWILPCSNKIKAQLYNDYFKNLIPKLP